MQSRKNIESPQIKQWKQEWKICSRKVDESEKSYMKMLTAFAEVNPESAQKINNISMEYESAGKKGEKQSQIVYTKLRKINESIIELKQTLKYFDKTNENLLKIQKLSQGILGKMDAMKNQMANSYDDLDDLQRKLSTDLELIDRRIEQFDNMQEDVYAQRQPKLPMKKAVNKENIASRNNNENKSMQEMDRQQPKSKLQKIQMKMKLKQQQVEKVEQQIKQLGKCLGWHEEDHKDFVTIWNRNQPNKTYFQIQDELIEYFRMYTNEQIIEHMNKYMKFKKLNEKKKLLISEYKELKEEKKEQEIAKLKQNENAKQMKIKKEEQVKKAEQEQKQMKEKLQQWKKQKQQMKVEEQRRMIEEEQRRKKLEMQKRKEQEAKRKQIIDKWKQEQQQKKQKQQAASKQSAKRPQSAVNKQTKERIREREEQIIKQKMEKAIQKKMQQQELEKKVERIKEQKMVKYAHVNSKLEEKTTAVKEKQREKFDGKDKKDANTFGGQLFIGGMRAIPQWRQGL